MLLKNPKIALMMIVKNEERPLPKLISSVKHLITEWVIVDTGSTDNTKQIIQEMLGDLPGQIIDRPWVNFGHNRSELLRNFPDNCDYALLLDADHIIAVDKETIDEQGNVNLNIPEGDCMMLLVEDHNVVYRMPYFVRKRTDMFYEGATHEYLTAHSPLKRVEYNEIRIRHTAEGGSRGDKFERDLRLLTEELKVKPSARNYFYLGQTYGALNQAQEAIEAYENCIEKTVWDEEKYLALLRVGRLLLQLDQKEKALIKFLLAHETFKQRSEACLEAARILTSFGLRKHALQLLEEGVERCPQGGILLIERWVCLWGLETELGSTQWWLGDKFTAKKTFENVLKREDLPEHAINLLKKNLSFC